MNCDVCHAKKITAISSSKFMIVNMLPKRQLCANLQQVTATIGTNVAMPPVVMDQCKLETAARRCFTYQCRHEARATCSLRCDSLLSAFAGSRLTTISRHIYRAPATTMLQISAHDIMIDHSPASKMIPRSHQKLLLTQIQIPP